MNIFAERLIEVRKLRNLTQTVLASKTQISQAAISRWEKNKRLPNIEELAIIASCLEVSTDYLLGLTDVDNLSSDNL